MIKVISAIIWTISALRRISPVPMPKGERKMPMAAKTIGPEILKRSKSFEKYPYTKTTRVIIKIVIFSLIG
jgi:hypothetical protein